MLSKQRVQIFVNGKHTQRKRQRNNERKRNEQTIKNTSQNERTNVQHILMRENVQRYSEREQNATK